MTTNITHQEFPNGLTVTRLKEILAAWPETDANGEPCEVWLETGKGLSSQAVSVWPLNFRQSEDGAKQWADIILEPPSSHWSASSVASPDATDTEGQE